MINVSYNETNTKKLTELTREEIMQSNSFVGKWVHLSNPDEKEIEFVSNITNIPQELIKAPLDEEERSRIENEDGNLLILVDIPVAEENVDGDKVAYDTFPLGIIISRGNIVTVCLKDYAIARDFLCGKIKNADISKPTRFTFLLLFAIATKYLNYLSQIDKTSQRIKVGLHKSMKNKELIQLLDVENSLVYFTTSLKANNVVIDKLTRLNFLVKAEEDQDLIEDVGIESMQALEMCNTYRDILSGTMDAFASLISNNLNIVMKVLTSITVVISVPTLISSLFGMNVGGIPAATYKFGFWIVGGISLILAAFLGIFLYKKKML